jgi:hypothetical protein
MPFQDKYRSFIYVHDGAFEGEATAYDFTVSDSATPIGGFYASGSSLAEVVLHNTSATNSILVKAKQGTVGSALNEYSGIYKLEPLESRKFIFGSDMFFALGNYVSGDTATVHISALNATVTEPTAAPDTNHGPENIAAGTTYRFGPFTVPDSADWQITTAFTASGSGSTFRWRILDSNLDTYDTASTSFTVAGPDTASFGAANTGLSNAGVYWVECECDDAGVNLIGVTLTVDAGVTEP